MSIILAQVALETLSYMSIGPKSGRVPTGEWIAKALNAIGIAPDVPSRLVELSKLQKQQSWKHGPHIIAAFRNPMIRAISGNNEVVIDVYYEVKQLALWYLELALLRTFRYSPVDSFPCNPPVVLSLFPGARVARSPSIPMGRSER